MLASIPKLKVFAILLCRDRDRTDDLVQDTLLRACANISLFEPGTNMHAWLCAILRNQFYTDCRRGRRRHFSLDALSEEKGVKPEQVTRTEYNEFWAALAKLPPKQRQALLMVAISGLSYDAVAKHCGCPEGTIKSRVNRARSELARMLSIEGPDICGDDPVFSAAIERGPRISMQG
jgi:RNA polymerase sigma-70 factor (ECF subfamily)